MSLSLVSSHGLDHKSSLRKLPFPDSTREALNRLLRQCQTLAGKQPSPREVEAVLAAIDEFVFGCGGLAASSGSKNIMGHPALQELQMIQVLLEFVRCPANNLNELLAAFNLIFMESTKQLQHQQQQCFSQSLETQRQDRVRVLSKLISLAMGDAETHKVVLHCAGVWMQQQGLTSESSLRLARLLVTEHITLVAQEEPDKIPPGVSPDIPEASPVFACNLMTAISELYFNSDGYEPPPPCVVRLFLSWLHRSPMVPLATAALTPLPGASAAFEGTSSSYQTPLLGLARWAAMAPIVNLGQNTPESFAKIHLATLECLVEAKYHRSSYRSEIVTVKHVCLFIQRLEAAIRRETTNNNDSLDRLGQFLQALMASECLSGKTVEVIDALRPLPANKLINMFVKNLVKH